MTANHQSLTDALLKRALAELAAGPDANVLLRDVLETVDASPQAGRQAWPPTLSWSRAALLAAALMVLTAALVGGAAVFSGLLRNPIEGSEEAPAFITPFTYAVPPGMQLDLTESSRDLYRWEGAAGGIAVLDASDARVMACRATPEGFRIPLRDDPVGFLEDLGAQGVGIGAVSSASIAGYSGASTAIDPRSHGCYYVRIIVGPGSNPDHDVALDQLGTLTAVDVNGTTVAVLTWHSWGQSADERDRSTAIESEFVNSIQFSGPR